MRRVWAFLLLLLLSVPLAAQGPITPAAAVTSTVYDGRTPLLPKFAIIDAATFNNNTIVDAVTGKNIRVLAATVTMTGTATTLRFESGAHGVALTGQMQPTQGQTIVLPFNPVGWFESTTLLNLELGAAVSVDGALVYVEVDP